MVARAISRGRSADLSRRLPLALGRGLCCWLCWWASLASPQQAWAQDQIPYLVKDLTPGVDASLGYAANQFVVLGNRVLFANLAQVWATDGTAAGTVQLAEVPCNDCDGVAIVATLGAVAFFAQEQVGSALWATDGTLGGTVMLAELGVVPQQTFAALGGKLFFSGCVAGSCGLVRSDGTVAGTTTIAAAGGAAIAVSGGKLYYFTTDGLWVSDGSAAGTNLAVPMQDLGENLGILANITAVANGVVFIAQQAGQPQQVWASNGTAAGTLPLTRFTPASTIGQLALTAPGDGRAYLVADDGAHGAQLWRTDGTAAGTVRMTNLTGSNILAATERAQIATVAGKVIFFAGGESGFEPWVVGGSPGAEQPLCTSACAAPQTGAMVKAGGNVYFVSLPDLLGSPATLWATDGTRAGTRRIASACANGCDVYSPLALVPQGGTLYFDVTPAAGAAPQLWATDGTAGGTRLVSLLAAGLGSLFSQLTNGLPAQAPPLATRGVQLFFAAADSTNAQQVWLSEGTPGSELQLTDFVQPRSSFPQAFVPSGSRVFFLAANGASEGLWQSDGTAAGTSLVPGAQPYSDGPVQRPLMAAGGGLLFYLQADSQAVQLWRTDGTAGGTLQLTALPTGTLISNLAAFPDGRLFFAVQPAGAAPDQAAAIWKSDGTAQGTVRAFDCPGSPNGLTVIGSSLYFAAIDTQGAHGIWKSDGTDSGSVLLTTFAPEAFPDPGYVPGFTAMGSRVFFAGLAPQLTLMVTDGTPAGTAPVALPPAGPAAPFNLTAGVTRIYLLDHDSHLWRSDGTAAGTAQVSADCCLAQIATLGDEAFFSAYGNQGVFLFHSDGTEAGTGQVFANRPISVSNVPLVVAGGRVFFPADDGEHGLELWQTDGTVSGSRMVSDLAPGPVGSSPAGMTQAGNLLFFAADDGLSGSQPWALPLAGGPACQPSDAWACLLGNRFRVEIAWRDGQGNSGAGHAVPLTGDTGWFWFFAPDNVEVILKVLDGTALDGHFWVFYGALSNVEYTITVTDTLTGAARRYENPPGQLASVGDTYAFGPLGAQSMPGLPASLAAAAAHRAARPARAAAPHSAARGRGRGEGAAGCQADSAHLCIQQGRFAVAVAWQDFSGRQGGGTTVPLTSDTGAFWFFDPTNIELVVKVLDGRAVNGKFWVFYGALSDVDYTLTVTDTATGAIKTYHNPAGQQASVADTSAF
jgi:ELWxxDGT repeat protein